MKLHKSAFISIIVILIFSLPIMSLIGHPLFDNTGFIRTVEKRDITVWSDVTSSDTFIDGFDSFFSDRLPFRGQIIGIYNNMLYSLKKSAFNSKVIHGKNGFMFTRINEEYHRGLIHASDYKIDECIDHLVMINEFFKLNDTCFLFASIPDKASVYPEYLPSWYTTTGEKSPNKMVSELAQLRNLEFYQDYTQSLLDMKDVYGDLLYYKTDTHYSRLGAYVSYTDMINNLNRRYNNSIIPITMSGFRSYIHTTNHDLIRASGMTMQVEDTETIIDYNEVFNDDYEIYRRKLEGYQGYFNPNALNEKTVLFIGDSFRTLQKPLFVNTFTSTYFMHITKDMDDIKDSSKIIDAYDIIKPDIVIIQSVERSVFDRALAMCEINDSFVERLFSNYPDAYVYDTSNYTELEFYYVDIVTDVNGAIHLKPENDRVRLLTNKMKNLGKNVVVKVTMSIDSDAVMRLYHRGKDESFNENHVQQRDVYTGKNEIIIEVDADKDILRLMIEFNNLYTCMDLSNIQIRIID